MKSIKPNLPKAVFLAKKQLAELVCDAVNLEGIHYTLPEVQTLLDGITVGGHKLSDQQITLNQAAAWQFLFTAIEKNTFELTSTWACKLHAIAGKKEALTWGKFRDGLVTISGTTYQPPSATELSRLWEKMLEDALKITDLIDRSIFIFLQMARYQFFYDVNKRMGRFMMNGLLLAQGYPIINLPAKRQLEFNTLMLDFYTSGDRSPMTAFMRSCYDPKILAIMAE